jgi:hypothetical protein
MTKDIPDINPHILQIVAYDNQRNNQFGESQQDGISREVAEDIGYTYAEDVPQLIDRISSGATAVRSSVKLLPAVYTDARAKLPGKKESTTQDKVIQHSRNRLKSGHAGQA